jgi:hypothetical protein
MTVAFVTTFDDGDVVGDDGADEVEIELVVFSLVSPEPLVLAAAEDVRPAVPE